MRVFTAIVPDEPAAEHLDAFLDVRRQAGAFRWSDEFHLTLSFHADLPEHAVDVFIDRLAQVAARHRPQQARIVGGGAFAHPDRAKVLWAGLRPDDPAALARLAASCRGAGSTVGAAADGTRFSPHLTVARTGRPQQVSDWVRLLDAYEGPAFTVDRVSLVASYLGEGQGRRPRYEVLAKLPFGT